MEEETKYQMWRILFFCFIITFALGASCQIDGAINDYEIVRDKVALGDSKNKVLSILSPTQKGLSSKMRKPPESYLKEDTLVEIFYFRSGRQPDGLTTDDEFTPYVFNNGKLVGIGWTVIGGAKSQGQTTPRTNVQQNVIVY
jgi:uncharacterized protein DUF3192